MCLVCAFANGKVSGGAIASGSNVHWQTKSHLELVTGGRTSTAHTLASIPLRDRLGLPDLSLRTTYPRFPDILVDYRGDIRFGRVSGASSLELS